MAAVFSSHGTLVASTVTTVDLVDGQFAIRITNRGGVDIFCRFDGTDPVVNADNTFIVPAGRVRAFELYGPLITADRTVKLISSGTPAFSVETA